MTDHVVPLTPPGANWRQREYVACVSIGVQFAAHGVWDLSEVFHYSFPEGINCISVIVDSRGPVEYIVHDFPRCPDWILKCAREVLKDFQ